VLERSDVEKKKKEKEDPLVRRSGVDPPPTACGNGKAEAGTRKRSEKRKRKKTTIATIWPYSLEILFHEAEREEKREKEEKRKKGGKRCSSLTTGYVILPAVFEKKGADKKTGKEGKREENTLPDTGTVS